MPSSTSNSKRKLRLPRLFFAEPSEIVPRDYERPIPRVPWRGMAVVVVIIVLAAAAAWEIYARSAGYAPTLNDTEDLWVQARRRVQPESLVIVGESRPLFDLVNLLAQPVRNFLIAPFSASCCSYITMCPAFLISSSLLFLIRLVNSFA